MDTSNQALYAGLIALGFAAVALGQSPPADSVSEHQRAGNPSETSRWAIPSDNGRYVGYLVGGGCALPRRADGPTTEEGTWGWDYQGWLLPRRIILGWWHGRRYQGGTGAIKRMGRRCSARWQKPSRLSAVCRRVAHVLCRLRLGAGPDKPQAAESACHPSANRSSAGNAQTEHGVQVGVRRPLCRNSRYGLPRWRPGERWPRSA